MDTNHGDKETFFCKDKIENIDRNNKMLGERWVWVCVINLMIEDGFRSYLSQLDVNIGQKPQPNTYV